ncbi:alpha-L-fucosidase, partial [Hyphomonas beringensis]
MASDCPQWGIRSLSYLPTVESLQTHEAPDWFRDAKFGIFIHW